MISVITVTYNSISTLQKTIESFINQDYSNKELIIIDGNSTDGTVDLIRQYSHAIKYWISEPDKGIPDALNKGIKAAKGNWLYFLSSDDVFYRNNVLTEVFQQDHQGLDMIYGNVILKSTGKVHDGEFNLKKITRKNICHQSQFFNKTYFEKLGNYNLKYQLLSDFDLTLRGFASDEIKIKYIDKIIAIFNDDGRTGNNLDNAFYADRKNIFINQFRQYLPVSHLAKAFETPFYFYLNQGKILKAIPILFDLILYTKSLSYLSGFFKLIKDNYKKSA